MKRQLLISTLIILFLVIGTVVAILYGKGYRFDFGGHDLVKGTGLLVATSTPDGASVYINDHLTTATNNTINLAPGDYTVTISKDGYFPWKKKIHIDQEVVSKANALLFPTTPKLESITETGVLRPVIDPSFTKIAYVVASQSARKNGIYVFNMANQSLLTLQSGSTQVADDTVVTFDTANLSWSPDGTQLLASIPSDDPTKSTTYLLDATSFNATPQDVTETLSDVESTWSKQVAEKATARLNTLKPDLKQFAISAMDIFAWSPDETKFIYTASASATIPQIIKPALIGADSTPEVRNVAKGTMYVYDTKEDKNFPLSVNPSNDGHPSITWFPDSNHIVIVQNKQIDIREYDGANNTTLYAGPFEDSYVFPWPDGSQLVILTDLANQSIPANLYTISLK